MDDPASLGRGSATGSVTREQIVEARIQLHYAAQVASAVGRSLAPRVRDHANAALAVTRLGAGLSAGAAQAVGLAGAQIPADRPFRTVLRFDPRPALVIDGGTGAEEIQLDGFTLESLVASLRDVVSRMGADGSAVVPRFARDSPAHPVGSGDPFTLAQLDTACRWVGAWFEAGWMGVSRFAARTEAAGPVHLWTDHFDVATAVNLDEGGLVTLGFSPGDAGTPLPYFYVTPWPPPTPRPHQLPHLPGGGRWIDEGWFGALLDASALEGSAPEGPPPDESARGDHRAPDPGIGDGPDAFLEGAFLAARAVIG